MKYLLSSILVVASMQFAASAFAQSAPAGMSDGCVKLHKKYLGFPSPKAFALSTNGHCGYSYGKGNLATNKSKAVRFCVDYGGVGCRVVRFEY